jgi:hypothetical protein
MTPLPLGRPGLTALTTQWKPIRTDTPCFSRLARMEQPGFDLICLEPISEERSL